MAKELSEGAQTVDRAVAILRYLGSVGAVGVRLVDLQQSMEFSKPTVHRILTSLRRHGLVHQDPNSRRYQLGNEVAILGWCAQSQTYDVRNLCQSAIHEIAERTGDSVFLFVRAGCDAVCIDRKIGAYPIKALVDDIGGRRPLCVGGGGLAILASLDQASE